MKMEECINDPKFRQAFVEEQNKILKNIIFSDNNIIYHNDALISILEEIKSILQLEDKELEILEEQLNELKNMNLELYKQKNRIDTMVSTYNKYLCNKKENNTLKLYNN
jgi:hypothetical protein